MSTEIRNNVRITKNCVDWTQNSGTKFWQWFGFLSAATSGKQAGDLANYMQCLGELCRAAALAIKGPATYPEGQVDCKWDVAPYTEFTIGNAGVIVEQCGRGGGGGFE